MRKKVIWMGISLLMVLSFVLVSYSTGETTKSTSTTKSSSQTTKTVSSSLTTKTSATTEEAKWWDKFGEPAYGGTCTVRTRDLNSISYDPAKLMGPPFEYWLERLFNLDWTADRSITPMKVEFNSAEYYKGVLAESWEQTDPTTYTIHIRKGINWQNKAPVNGREFTADDVQFHYDRLLGTGSGYTTPNAFFKNMLTNVEQVKAIDPYTVSFKLKNASAFGAYEFLNPPMTSGLIEPREWVALGGPPSNEPADSGGPGGPGGGPKGPGGGPGGPGGGKSSMMSAGPLSDWTTVIGTGPWMLTDVIQAASMTFSANPDYWDYDDRHPENKLPYMDSIKVLAIPDSATALAAMRTGKVEIGVTATWQDWPGFVKTNPDIQYSTSPGLGMTLDMRCDHEPFTDIRVREALQMAVNRPAIAKSYYGGTVDGKPAGLFHPAFVGYYVPYDEWPKELQDKYAYDPDGAKQLLIDAGYPQGFNTECIISTMSDSILLQIIQANFRDIGVEMEIKVMDQPAFMPYCFDGKNEQIVVTNAMGISYAPSSTILRRTSNQDRENFTHNNDPKYDEIVARFIAAPTIEEAKKISRESDLYCLEQCWSVRICPAASGYSLWQSWLKGYSGEHLNSEVISYWGARWWIDQEVKKASGK